MFDEEGGPYFTHTTSHFLRRTPENLEPAFYIYIS